jgi:tripartite-type tricarboxylate transporter receptor subunit TctC
MALAKSSTLTPLAVSSEQRMRGYPNLPTFREFGAPIGFVVTRSVVGSPAMSADARDYYALVFASLYRTNEWRSFLDEIGMSSNFVTGQGLKDEWRRRVDENYVMQDKALVKK